MQFEEPQGGTGQHTVRPHPGFQLAWSFFPTPLSGNSLLCVNWGFCCHPRMALRRDESSQGEAGVDTEGLKDTNLSKR